MKRLISVIMILCLVMGLLAGCSSIDQERNASADALVGGGSLENATQTDNPTKVEGAGGDSTEPGDSSTPGDSTEPGDSSTPGDSTNSGNSNSNSNSNGDSTDAEDGDIPSDKNKIPSDAIIIASFNIKRFFDGTTADMVCDEIKTSGCHIIGLQEVSNGQAEIGKVDQTKYMAEKCGFKYYSFCPAAYNDQYGTCILSKYKIKSTQNVSYSSQVGEHRKYSRSVLDVNGQEVIFYNTHLSTQGQDSVTGAKQFQEVLNKVYNDLKKNPTVLTGDFNLYMSDQKKYVDVKRLIPMNGGESMTFPVTNNNTTLDNIYVSKAHWEPVWYNEKFDGYVDSIYSEASDHDIIWGYLKLK
jgi:endonuclease/exonuclease/phosphatase family metal-dependent hydrolase